MCVCVCECVCVCVCECVSVCVSVCVCGGEDRLIIPAGSYATTGIGVGRHTCNYTVA